MRLTKKTKLFRGYTRDFAISNVVSEMTYKLGQLEDILEGHNIETLEELDGLLWYVKQIKDIKEEIGIDLITLFKALKNGIYIKEYDEERNPLIHIVPCCLKMFTRENHVDLPDKEIWGLQVAYHYNFKLKDYKKTWALSKEELL